MENKIGARRRILYVQYTNPAGYPPLEHSSRILALAGWKVLFLGTGAFGTDDITFLPHPGITVKKMRFCSSGWWQKIHYLLFCVWVATTAFFWRPAWIYASEPLSCPVVLWTSFFSGCPILYHEHDSPGALYQKTASRFMRAVFWFRRQLAIRAQICVLPNQRRADLFAFETGARKVLCIWNCPSMQEIGPPLASRSGRVQILYQGSIVPSRLPLTVIQALGSLPESVGLTIVGYETVGHVGYIEVLRALSRQLGVERRVNFAGTIKQRKDMLQRASECDLGLAFIQRLDGNPNMEHMEGASNKPFDYLARGLALLVPDLPEWERMFVRPGYGLACNPDDPKEIAAALRWFLDHPEQMRQMGERGRQRVKEEWNYEKQFSSALRYLEE